MEAESSERQRQAKRSRVGDQEALVVDSELPSAADQEASLVASATDAQPAATLNSILGDNKSLREESPSDDGLEDDIDRAQEEQRKAPRHLHECPSISHHSLFFLLF